MPDRQEVFSSLYGAYRLAWFDESGLGYLNISVEGFWRSFFAAVILVPFYLLSTGQDIMVPQGGFSFWALLVHLFTYAASWIIFPLVAFFAADLLNLGHRFTTLVVAVNWSSVLTFGVLTLGIGFLALVPQQALADLALVILTAGLVVYHWFVIKTALDTTAPIAIAFVLFNFLLGAMIHQLTERLL